MFSPDNPVYIPKVEFKPFKADLALSCAHAYVLCVFVCASMCVQKLHTHDLDAYHFLWNYVHFQDEQVNRVFKRRGNYFSKIKSFLTTNLALYP